MRWPSLLLLLVALLPAACAPPQPFQPDDKRSAARLLTPRADSFVYVPPLGGLAAGRGEVLADAVAADLRERGIPAFSDQANRGAHLLFGEVRGDRLVWQLLAPDGRPLAEAPSPYADRDPPARVARRAGEALEGVIRPGVAAAPPVAPPKVRVTPVEGAPGDGGPALTRAMRAALTRRNIDLSESAPDAVLRAEVRLSEGNAPQTQKIEIVWILAAPAGAEMGRLDQANLVPRGRLDRTWGNIAWDAAEAAADGVLEILDAKRRAD